MTNPITALSGDRFYDRSDLILYLSEPGHVERRRILSHLAKPSEGYLYPTITDDILKGGIERAITKLNLEICDEGRQRFHDAFPTLMDAPAPKTRIDRFTVEVEVPVNHIKSNIGDIEVPLTRRDVNIESWWAPGVINVNVTKEQS